MNHGDHEPAARFCIIWQHLAQPCGIRSPTRVSEFTEKGRDFSVAVDWRVLSNDTAFNLRLARAGAGLAVTYVDIARKDIRRGTLVRVLAAYCPPFPGCFLYYPQHRQASPALRAFVECLRAARKETRKKRGH